MMPEDKNDDAGIPAGDGVQTPVADPQSNPDQSNGSQPVEDWKTKHDTLLEQNKALNRAVVEARRQANLTKGTYKPGQVNDQGDGGTQPQDYLTAKKIATADLYNELDSRFSLYDKEVAGLPASLKQYVQQLRRNPWGFVSDDASGTLNTAMAADEVEQLLANLVQANSVDVTPAPQEPKIPDATVKPNQPSSVPNNTPDAEPGSAEDENPFTMPLDKLKGKASKQIRSISSK